METIVEYTMVIAAVGSAVTFLGIILATSPFAWAFRPRGSAWYFRKGRGSWFTRPGHERGFAALRSILPRANREISIAQQHASSAERARAWVQIATAPFVVTGMVAVASAYFAAVAATGLDGANSAWIPTFLGLQLFATVAFGLAFGLNQLLPQRLMPRELHGALQLADALALLTLSTTERSFLGSEVARSLRALTRSAKASLRAGYHEPRRLPATRNLQSLAFAMRRLNDYTTGSSDVDRGEALLVAWRLSSVWRPDAPARRRSPVPAVIWPRHSWISRKSAFAASPIVIAIIAALAERLVSLV